MSLRGRTVLVTRPAGRADALLEAIEAAGGVARHIPLLDIVPLDQHNDADLWLETRDRAAHLGRYSAVIAISVNAVHYGLSWIGRYWQQRVPADIKWYGIGAATQAALARWNVQAEIAGAGSTSEALLALPQLQNLEGQRFLVLRGVGGRETLAQGLLARGAEVDLLECYRRQRPQLAAPEQQRLWQPPADAVCINSAETLANLWHYLSTAQARCAVAQRPLLVPSARVADSARELGFEQIVVSADAGTAATLAALQSLSKDPAW